MSFSTPPNDLQNHENLVALTGTKANGYYKTLYSFTRNGVLYYFEHWVKAEDSKTSLVDLERIVSGLRFRN